MVAGQWRLVAGKELYDVNADRAQAHDVAAEQPEVVAKLRSHYESWWAALEPKINDWIPCATLGSEAEPLVELTSSDWQDAYVDNANHIRAAEGGPRGSHWNVRVERAGQYEIALRRWPRELDRPLNAGVPAGVSGNAQRPIGKALPIAAATLAVAGRDVSEKAQPGAKEVVLRVELPAGETRLQAWFQDADGIDLCGAFYASVRRR